MARVRRPAVAGTFYPDDPFELAATIDHLLGAVAPVDELAPPVALIAPHAGYVYSGPVAATAYAHLVPWRDAITRVVVIGPAHRVLVRGLAVASLDGFATPLGVIPLDGAARAAMLEHAGVSLDDRAHAPEHSIEVHLPFLQRVLGNGWTLVPIVAGDASADLVADVLEPVWGTPGTLVVVSTDLSHYHDLATARRLDRETAALIVAGSWERLDHQQACGATPVRGALELSRRHGDEIELVDLRTSGDTAGPENRVVGYGSFVLR